MDLLSDSHGLELSLRSHLKILVLLNLSRNGIDYRSLQAYLIWCKHIWITSLLHLLSYFLELLGQYMSWRLLIILIIRIELIIWIINTISIVHIYCLSCSWIYPTILNIFLIIFLFSRWFFLCTLRCILYLINILLYIVNFILFTFFHLWLLIIRLYFFYCLVFILKSIFKKFFIILLLLNVILLKLLLILIYLSIRILIAFINLPLFCLINIVSQLLFYSTKILSLCFAILFLFLDLFLISFFF